MAPIKRNSRILSVGVSDILGDTLQAIATIKATTISDVTRKMINLGLETYERRSQAEMAPMDHAYTTLKE